LANPTDNGVDRGSWTGDDQAETAREAWTSLPDQLDEASDVDRAARAAARVFMRRAGNAQSNGDPNQPAIILISTSWRRLGKDLGWASVPVVDDGSQPLRGSIFICPPNLSAAYKVALPSTELSGIYEWIESQGLLCNLPALVLNPEATTPELRLYEAGLGQPEVVSKYPLHFAHLDLETLDNVLNRFHSDVVCAPGGGRKCVRLWEDSHAFQSVSRPEKAIQGELFRFLRTTFTRLQVAEEEDTPRGRLDLRLTGALADDDTIVVNHAVIELKVITEGNTKPPFTNTEGMKTHIENGVRQAASYRKPPGESRIAMLGCYDMRPHAGQRGDSCLDHIRQFAADECVEVRRWPLFPNVKALREHLMPGTSPAV
jgi:hypothetical protein